MTPREADSLERYYERLTRAEGRAAVAEGLADYREAQEEECK